MKRIFLFTLLILTVIPRDSEAQIINVENAHMQSDTTGCMGNVGALVSMIKNTEEVFPV